MVLILDLLDIVLLNGTVAPFFLFFKKVLDIPLNKYAIFYLSALLLVDIWVVFSFWLL